MHPPPITLCIENVIITEYIPSYFYYFFRFMHDIFLYLTTWEKLYFF